jgi:hypothetical protein
MNVKFLNFDLIAREEIAVYSEAGIIQINANVWENYGVF